MSEPGPQPPAASPAPKLIDQLQSGVPAALAMLAGVRLDVFSQLAAGPREAAEIAKALGVESARLSRLLFALVASGLLERCDAGFANSPEAATYFAKSSPYRRHARVARTIVARRPRDRPVDSLRPSRGLARLRRGFRRRDVRVAARNAPARDPLRPGFRQAVRFLTLPLDPRHRRRVRRSDRDAVRPQPGDERCLVRLAAHRTAGGTENGAAAALAWVLAQGRDIVPLVGARKRGQWAD